MRATARLSIPHWQWQKTQERCGSHKSKHLSTFLGVKECRYRNSDATVKKAKNYEPWTISKNQVTITLVNYSIVQCHYGLQCTTKALLHERRFLLVHEYSRRPYRQKSIWSGYFTIRLFLSRFNTTAENYSKFKHHP